MEKYNAYIYASLILIIVAGILAIIGYQMVQNVEAYNVEGIPVSDFFRFISSDFNIYYSYSLIFLIGGSIGCAIGCVLVIVFAFLQNKESIAKSKVKNISSQVNMESLPTKDEAINILRTRYAKGEITKEQLEQMKKDIKI